MALINGFLSTGVVKPEDIVIFDIDSSKYDSYIMSGLHIAHSSKEAVAAAEYTVIASKPQNVAFSMSELSEYEDAFENTTFISIAAAVPMEFICFKLGTDVPVIRAMPSTPMLIGMGAVAICKNILVIEDKFDFICSLFSQIAELTVVDEKSMNPIISVNGSSPAYVYLFIKSMLEGALELGIPSESALPLILKTIEGAVGMVRHSDTDLDELIRRVASPNGTTLAALNSLYKDDFSGSVKRAMRACTERADEITRELNE